MNNSFEFLGFLNRYFLQSSNELFIGLPSLIYSLNFILFFLKMSKLLLFGFFEITGSCTTILLMTWRATMISETFTQPQNPY